MVNYRDPVVMLKDFCEYTLTAERESSKSQLRSPFDSGSHEVLAYPGWSLYVSLRPHNTACPTITTRLSTSSWEFFTTLDYEWSIIRGHRPYRWTIVVRIETHFPSSFVARLWAYLSLLVDLFCYTPGRSHRRDTFPGRF